MATGAKQTNAEFLTWINSNINTNGTQAITGDSLNTAFQNIYFSILFAQIERRFQVACTAGAPRSIAFDNAMPSADYSVTWVVRDSGGNPVAVKVNPALQTAVGFYVEVSHNSIIDFTAIEHY